VKVGKPLGLKLKKSLFSPSGLALAETVSQVPATKVPVACDCRR